MPTMSMNRMHGANETSKHTPKRAHPLGGEGSMEFFYIFLFSWKSGFSSHRISKKINIFQVPQGSQKYRSMLLSFYFHIFTSQNCTPTPLHPRRK